MTSTSHLADLIKNVDPVDGLRLLVADTQALADRLGLKERSRSLQQTLKSTQERVFGPHAAVMLLAEDAALKRRFLERLLGSDLKHVPDAIAACTRLEYGSEAECTVTMPQGLTAVLPLEQLADFLERRSVGMPGQVMQGVRLPNSTLARGLAVIDTPPIQEGSTAHCVLESAAQTDAWVFVLDADHALSEASQSVIRQLPDGAARLEIVIEGAESLSGEARVTARDRLVAVLKEQCGISEPRLTLVASPDAEGEENGFWHGRFATFHSVLMLRGRERWLESTRTVVADALAEVNAEIGFELRTTGLGLRQARLRMGLKELEELRDRFFELGRLDKDRPREGKPPTVAESWADSTHPPQTPASPLPQDAEQRLPDEEAAAIPPAPMGEPTFVKFRGQDPTPETRSPPPSEPASRRRIAVHLNEDVGRLLHSLRRRPDRPVDEEGEKATTLPWRIAGAALVACFLCLVGWVVWPRMHVPGREPATQWNYQPTPDGATNAAGTAPGRASGNAGVELPPPVEAHAGPDAAGGEAMNGAGPTPATPRTATHIPLSRPVAMLPQARRAHKRRHGLFGLGRVWHWIRHPAGGGSNEQETEH